MNQMLLMRRVCGGGDVEHLPDGVIRVEYIESSGSQYIDSGVYPSDNIGYIATFMNRGSSAKWYTLFGGRVSDNSDQVSLNTYSTHGFAERTKSGDNRIGFNCTYGDKLTVSLLGNTFTKPNGTTATMQSTGSFTGTNKIYIFCLNQGGNRVEWSYFRLYELTFCFADTVIRHFIPVRIGQTGYLYDKVSGQLFDNIGTGNFILGPDV